MAIGKLGTIHKAVYASKNFLSGLADISIKVLKPNGSVHASGIMTEFSEAGFEGVYYFNISTTVSDPVGEYTALITSPTQLHKAKMKVTLVDNLGGGGGVSDSIDTIELELDISPKSLDMSLDTGSVELLLKSSSMELETGNSAVLMDMDSESLNINIDNDLIDIELECNK